MRPSTASNTITLSNSKPFALWIVVTKMRSRTLLLPQENKKDLEDVPEYVRKVFDIILVENIGDVLKVALLPKDN